MMAIADDRHFRYDNENDLLEFIDSEMEKEGLDVNNEENLDSYLNTKFMTAINLSSVFERTSC